MEWFPPGQTPLTSGNFNWPIWVPHYRLYKPTQRICGLVTNRLPGSIVNILLLSHGWFHAALFLLDCRMFLKPLEPVASLIPRDRLLPVRAQFTGRRNKRNKEIHLCFKGGPSSNLAQGHPLIYRLLLLEAAGS